MCMCLICIFCHIVTQIVANYYICLGLLKWRCHGKMRCVRKLLEGLPIEKKKP